jgi:hypothetical protein
MVRTASGASVVCPSWPRIFKARSGEARMQKEERMGGWCDMRQISVSPDWKVGLSPEFSAYFFFSNGHLR